MRATPFAALVLLAACAAPMGDASAELVISTPGAEAASSSPVASPSSQPTQALDLLDCDEGPSTVGGFGEDLASFGGGDTPAEALAAFLEYAAFVIPREGYVPLASGGGRHAYGYLAGGEVKVVIVISGRFGQLFGAQFTADELRTCPEGEFGAAADFGDGRRVWTHDETGLIVTDLVGPQHCGWQTARMLHLETGAVWRQYLRDPFNVFHDAPLLDRYAEGVQLPADASFSGYRSPDGFELWLTDEDRAAYVVTPDGVERWPRADPPVGCA